MPREEPVISTRFPVSGVPSSGFATARPYRVLPFPDRPQERHAGAMFTDISQYLWLAWLVVVVACVVLELLTLQLLFLMIAVGSLVGGLGAWLLGWPWYGQIGAAAILSGLLVFLVRPLLLRRLMRGEAPRTNVDALYGMDARATVAFQDGAGMARLANGETWTARLAPKHEADPVPPGSPLTVARIDGATAVVVPTTDPAATSRERSAP